MQFRLETQEEPMFQFEPEGGKKADVLVPFFKKNIYLFICLFIYLAVPGLSCSMQDLHCGVRDL